MSISFIAVALFCSNLYIYAKAHNEDITGYTVSEEYAYYCNQKCFDNSEEMYTEHVVCTYYPCLPSYRCGPEHKRLPFTEDEKDFIVHLHNAKRELLASGKEQRAGNSKASDMVVLSYDKELEFLASCWANQCKESPIPELGRDMCRATELSSHNGQNHWAYASDNYDIKWDDKKFIEEAVEYWYDQISNSSERIIDRYTTVGSRYFEFFTQLVWSSTYLLGCGRTRFSADRYVGIIIVCNYSPGGNIPDQAVYSRGEPCTKYRDMKINAKYPSLCGKIRPYHDDTYVAPFPLSASQSRSRTFLIAFELLFYFLL